MNVPSKIFVAALICMAMSQSGSPAGAAPLVRGGIGPTVHGGFGGVGGMGGLHAGPGAGPVGGFRGPVGGRPFGGGWGAGGAVAAGTFRGGWRGEDWRRGHERRGLGFGVGFATGALVSTALAAPWYYYDDYDYYAPAYYDYGYDASFYDYGYDYDDSAIRYCETRYKSYDPVTRTYVGYDGRRHPCP